MSELKAPSLQSLLESERGSTDSLLAESLQLDFEDVSWDCPRKILTQLTISLDLTH